MGLGYDKEEPCDNCGKPVERRYYTMVGGKYQLYCWGCKESRVEFQKQESPPTPETINFIYPHCDNRVLHAPTAGCIYCNERPEWQKLRMDWGINFTGENDPSKLPCPAETRRSLENIEKWPGNRVIDPDKEIL